MADEGSKGGAKPAEAAKDEPTEGHQRILAAGVDARHAKALVDAGYDTPEKVALASDAELIGAKGLGADSLRAIRRGAIPAREQSDR